MITKDSTFNKLKWKSCSYIYLALYSCVFLTLITLTLNKHNFLPVNYESERAVDHFVVDIFSIQSFQRAVKSMGAGMFA